MKKTVFFGLVLFLSSLGINAQSLFLQTYWPQANGAVRVIVEDALNNKVYIGGAFTTVGGVTRNHVACIDALTGSLTSWDPNVTGNNVLGIALDGSDIYICGTFTDVGGQPHANIAKVNNTTGAVDAWNPNANNIVNKVVIDGTTMYAVGRFTSIGGLTRRRVAALDLATGNAISGFNCNTTGGEARCLIKDGNTLYVGGNFTTMNSVSHPKLAKVDATTGAVDAWTPAPSGNGNIHAMALSGTTLFVGGDFDFIGTDARSNVAAVDVNTGLATAWNPGADNIVYSLALNGNTLYCGGSFLNFGGDARTRFAAVDATTGLNDSFTITSSGNVRSLSYEGDILLLGGGFTNINGSTRQRLAAFSCAPATPVANANQTFCEGATANDIAATGTNLQWYTAPTGGSPLAGNTLLSDATTYYGTQTVNSCESFGRVAVTISISVVASPTGTNNQTFCNSATLDDAVVSGNQIQWYDAPTGGNLLPGTTPIVDATSYYATQTVTGCESFNRFQINATLNVTGAPTGTGPQDFCGSGTIAQLVALGGNIQWYANPTGGSALPPATPIVNNTTYYGTQTINGCESDTRLPIVATITQPIPMPGFMTGPANLCGRTTATYSVPPVTGATSYTWTLPTGLTGTSITNSIAVVIDNSFTSGIIGVVANANSCTSNQRTIGLSLTPYQPNSIIGQQDNVCEGTFTYSITPTGGSTSHLWTVPAGATITSPNGGTSITVNFSNAFSGGAITVSALNNCGGSLSRSLNVTPVPKTPTSISGPATVCANQNGVVFSVTPVNGAANMQWIVPSSATLVSGQGTPSITVNWGTFGGIVRVTAVNTCGSGAQVTKLVNVNCREDQSGDWIQLENESAVPYLSIYPNPGSDRMVVTVDAISADAAGFIQVLDAFGKVVFEERITSELTELNMADLSAGIYFVRTNNPEVPVQRWLKQ